MSPLPHGDLPDRPLAIVVLLGGWSAERAISLESGRAVIAALRSRGHDVRELDPAEIDLLTYPWWGVDIAFLALHGSFGEDGTVQTLLEELGVPYTGSTPGPSRAAMSKSASKQRFTDRGLPTPAHEMVHASELCEAAAARVARLGYPLVVKPDAQGSSIGVTVCEHPDQLPPALDAAFRHDPLALVERFVPGRELTVGVLDGQAMPLIEIRPARPFFDFHAKYHDESTAYVFDTGLPDQLVGDIERLAVSAAEALGTSGIARVDLRLDPDQRPWLLEVNTIPGLTDHSLVPKAAARAGISFTDLCERLVRQKLSAQRALTGSQAA